MNILASDSSGENVWVGFGNSAHTLNLQSCEENCNPAIEYEQVGHNVYFTVTINNIVTDYEISVSLNGQAITGRSIASIPMVACIYNGVLVEEF